MKTFKKKVAVVTGAASGIGQSLAETFIEAGMKVVLSDVNEESLNDTVKTLKEAGGEVIGVAADVSNIEQVENLAERTMEAFGAVHVLCNNAGVCYNALTWETPMEAWKWVIGVNLMGVVHGVHVFLPIMLKQDTEGHIVNTSSISGIDANPMFAAYGATKAGVVSLTETLYYELSNLDAKIKLSVMCPGPVNTKFNDTSEENRPDWVPLPQQSEEEMAGYLDLCRLYLKEKGLNSRDVAQMVMDAIRNEQFYILPHEKDMNHLVEKRMKNLLASEHPPKETIVDPIAAWLSEIGAPNPFE